MAKPMRRGQSGDPKLAGLAAVLAIAIGARLMQVSSTPPSPGRQDRLAASLPKRRNVSALLRPPSVTSFPERDDDPGTLPAIIPQVAGDPTNRHPDDGECSRWAAEGQCQSNPAFMLASCLLGCSTEDRLALHIAARSGDAAAVSALLRAGAVVAAVDVEGYSALHGAAFNGQADAALALLRGGAAPDTARAGVTALHLAAYNGHETAVRALLEGGASVGPRDGEGRNPLTVAAFKGHVATVRALVEVGAPLDEADKEGRTALHAAANQNQVQVVQMLIGAGANLESTDGVGSAALHLAALGGKLEAFQVLLASGAPYVRSRVLHLSPLDCIMMRDPPKSAVAQSALIDAVRALFNGSSTSGGPISATRRRLRHIRRRVTRSAHINQTRPSRRSALSGLFDRPTARQGTWRTVGFVRPRRGPEVVVLASERGAGGTLRKVGVIPFIPEPLRRETMALVTRRDFAWTSSRHQRHPTTDQEVFRVPWLDARISSLLRTRLMPGIAALFGVRTSELLLHDLFLVKYEMAAQRALEVHRDGSCFSFMVQLNALREFTGGGTRFSFTEDSRPSSPLSVPAGHAMLFSGRFLHEGANLTAGVRYLLVGFVHYAAPVRSMDSFSAHLLQDGAHACSGSVHGAYKTGSHFNYEQLRRASGAKSGGHLVHMLAANHASMPHLDPRSLRQLSIWCRRWLRVNATLRHVKKAGSNTRHQGWYRRKMQKMPLEVHAFLHHAIGWQITAHLREQPRARLSD